MLHSGVDTLLFKLIKLNRNLLYPQAYVSLGNAQLGCKLQFEIMGRVEGSGIYNGGHSAMPPSPSRTSHVFFCDHHHHHHHHHLFAQTRRRTHDQHENKSRTRKAQKTGAYTLPIKRKKTNTLDIKTTTTITTTTTTTHTVKTQTNLRDLFNSCPVRIMRIEEKCAYVKTQTSLYVNKNKIVIWSGDSQENH